VSFDRVAQVASILVLGPVDAAWINGLASLIYPWHRLWSGVPARTVLTAALNNAGLMSLTILLCGLLYQQVGGPIPIVELDFRIAGLLLLLALSMQLVNDLGMMVLLHLRNLKPSSLLNVFTTGVELVSVLIAILFAVAYTSLGSNYFGLLLVVTSIGMLVLKQYAIMRLRLEALVQERTEELRLKTIELERQATHDKLTGLLNRRYADDYMAREIEVARRHNRTLTIALADIDHFKKINDRFSHGIGDEVLRRVADILVDRCRKTDLVARYGGEEFLLCFPDTDPDFAEQICSQIRMAVENADWSDINERIGQEISITMSFGIAAMSSDSRCTTILNDADTRLYQAKNTGRNRVVS
jgi:diguanylate cyclase (GGDEF)-like protein